MALLSVTELLKEWESGRTRPVCCLTGEERALKDGAVKKLKDRFGTGAFNFSEYDAETADMRDLISAAMTPGLDSGTRLIVLKGAEKLKKEPAAELADYVKSPSGAAMLVILLDRKTDASETITAALPPEAALTDFAPLESGESARYAKSLLEKEGLSASDQALELLAETCSFDAGTIRQEAAKLAALHHGLTRRLEPDDIMESAGFSRTLNPFEFSNAVQSKNGPLAAGIADKMMAEGAEPLGVVISLAYVVEKLLKVKTASAGRGDEAAWALGMNPGYYRRLLAAAGAFQAERLSFVFNRCLETEAALKSSSGADPRLLVKQLIFEATR